MKQDDQAKRDQTIEEKGEAQESAPVASDDEEVKKLQAELEEVKKAVDDLNRKWYSVSAEYENYRKRTAATRSQAYAEGRADVVVKLFPIGDNLERAYASTADEKIKAGLMMVIKSFEKLLEEEKITVIDPVGEEFDAEKCEAIMAVDPEEGDESGTVKSVYLKGYEQNGKVLRFAQVVVVK